jgi:hypothetical protein
MAFLKGKVRVKHDQFRGAAIFESGLAFIAGNISQRLVFVAWLTKP